MGTTAFGLAELQAIAPSAVVALAAIVVLMVEAFFAKPDEPAPLFGLSVVGLIAGILATALLWGDHASGFSEFLGGIYRCGGRRFCIAALSGRRLRGKRQNSRAERNR